MRNQRPLGAFGGVTIGGAPVETSGAFRLHLRNRLLLLVTRRPMTLSSPARTPAQNRTATAGAALFITYDGLLDPLGGSQILPYIRGIAAHPRQVHVLSFEKPERFAAGGEALREQLASEGIGWTAVPFSTRFGKLGKARDLARMQLAALRLQMRHRFAVVHCRSYQAMQAGAMLARLTGVRTIFDMRGLWVDERIDGGIWRRERLADRLLFNHYKRIERRLLESADHIVSLTARVIPELRRIAPHARAPITIIPCCADFKHFQPTEAEQRNAVRERLGISPGARVIGYLGSLGTWYMLEEMLQFLRIAAQRRPDTILLLITRDWNAECEKLVEQVGGPSLRRRLRIQPATRDEVPGLLGACDVMLSFIKPAYSKLASSPTKLAEAHALGLPAISNCGIGDVDEQTERLKAGLVFDLADPAELERAATKLDEVIALGGPSLRSRAEKELDLEIAHKRYRAVYDAVDFVRAAR